MAKQTGKNFHQIAGDKEFIDLNSGDVYGERQFTPTEWSVTGLGDNIAADALKAGASGKTYYVTRIIAGFVGGAATKLLTFQDGGTVLARIPIKDEGRIIEFRYPRKISLGFGTLASLAASGTGGTIGYVTIEGFTVG